MRTPRSAYLYPLLAVLLTSTAAVAAPRLVLPDSPMTPRAASRVAQARQVLGARAPASVKLELTHTRTQSLPGGQTMVRFAQRHHGIPVLSRGASVLLDAKGNPTQFAAARLAEHFATSDVPSLTPSLAAERANGSARGAGFTAGDARLAWFDRFGAARLVWVLYRGLVPGTPRSPVALIDAHSGRLVLAYDATRFDRAATVYEENPVSTPTAVSVKLSTLAPGATKLEDPKIRAVTCVDTQKLVGKWGVHMCELLPKAAADGNGDFPQKFASDTAAEDDFAELSLYFHTAKAYAFYQTLGMPELDIKPLTAVANLRFPQGWSTGNVSAMKNTALPLEPYDNAFFSPKTPYPGMFENVEGGLFFGQGSNADFAYDGDVVYHELGHALTDRTIDFAPYWQADEQGATPAPGAMNEGLADYFSSALTGDGKLGEYAAKNTSYGYGGDVIRDLDNADTCPKSLAGEVHVDSTLFSGALWSVRQALPEGDRNTFDTALVTALIGAPTGEVGYEDLAELMRATVEASTLGKTVAAALKAEFEKRGVLPVCQRVLEYKGKALQSAHWKIAHGFYSPGKPYVGFEQTESYAPGLLQVHVALKPDTEKLRVDWQNYPLGGQYQLGPEADPYTPAVLVRFASDPIVFDYSTGVSSNASALVDTETSVGDYVNIDVPAGATDAYLMIVNKGDEMGLFTSLEVTQKSAATGGTGGMGGFGASGGFGGFGGSGGTGGTGGAAADDPGYDQAIESAWGCSSVPGGPGSWLSGGLLAGAIALVRRRRKLSR